MTVQHDFGFLVNEAFLHGLFTLGVNITVTSVMIIIVILLSKLIKATYKLKQAKFDTHLRKASRYFLVVSSIGIAVILSYILSDSGLLGFEYFGRCHGDLENFFHDILVITGITTYISIILINIKKYLITN